MHCIRRAASRAACTAGSSRAIRTRDDRDHHQQLDQGEARTGESRDADDRAGRRATVLAKGEDGMRDSSESARASGRSGQRHAVMDISTPLVVGSAVT